MSADWHQCISGDLDRVEALMDDIVASDSDQLTEMCRYVLHNHGKRVRPAITILSYKACGGDDPKRAIDVGAAVELIHNATLIHDDINDQGEMRRGAKALYKEYTIGKSIVAGDFIFAKGFQLLGATSQDIVDFVIEAASAMGSGEFVQKKYERSGEVTEADYMRIIQGKTAHLIECGAKCGAFLAGESQENVEKVGDFAYLVGQAFQIVDDVLDVDGEQMKTGKKVGNDLVEGKPTLPTIYAMQDPTYGPRIREIFQDEHSDYDKAREAIELINRTDSIPRCRALASSIAEEGISRLDFMPGSVYKDSLIGLARFIVSRDR